MRHAFTETMDINNQPVMGADTGNGFTPAEDADAEIAEAKLSQIFINSLPGVFYVVSERGKFLRWNKTFELVTGYSPEEIAAAHVLDLFGTAAEKALVAERIAKVFAEGSASVEASLRTKSGKSIPYYFNGNRIELGGQYCCCGMGMDITERRRREETLRLRNRAIEASVNAIIITNIDGIIEYANRAFAGMTGHPLADVIQCDFVSLLGDDANQHALAKIRAAIRKREEGAALLRLCREDGELLWVDFHIAPVRDPEGAVSHFVGVLNDITELKRYEEQLEHQAHYDALTCLPNRNLLKDRIRQAIAAADRHGTGVTIGFMDLDNFKLINDSLGHNIGDELLKCVAQRLATCLRAEDTVARYGGDEFAFVLADLADEDKVAGLMERVLKTVDQRFDIGGHEFFISCSIGISFYPRDGRDLNTLLKNADTAMYRAKERGRNNFQFYTPAMNQRVNQRLSLERKLRQALENKEFELHYQPNVHLGTGKIVGIEALLRWHAPGSETIAPSAFIPLAEETGLIVPIGEWVLSTACADNKALQDAGLPPVRVAVNISARQFHPNQLGASISHALGASGLNSEYLELELTESLVMQNPEEVIGILLDLKEMGLWLAIDDFGTGYSSLSYLQRLPVDRLKIDQSFVRDIGADPNDAIIARAVISLGHSLGMSVIAEGVSKPEQLTFLRENGCDEMQGFLYSRPLPFPQLLALLRENRGLKLH
jgi:diguanylate cyclase (GGDEF)-like protein/PAS domain S-box-containing protein